jgi:tetratricopeptide (TPR) repeat protein
LSWQSEPVQPRAFVVMPFRTWDVPVSPDEGGGSRRVDFDELYDLLVAPALRYALCEPFRADKEPGAGDIRVDMFFELVTADLVVADISLLNPNVFYELGVRHGVAERGVFMIHAGWSRRPFDVAPDRTFSYDGSLFITSTERDDGWRARVEAEVARLGTKLRGARDADKETIGSPVYQALKGLRPADWSAIETARAKYFKGILDDWQERVRIARRNGHAGDVLTLARDAPTRFHHEKLLLEAAKALMDLQRFDVAESVLEDLLHLDPDNFAAKCRLGLVLGRLGRSSEAEERVAGVLEQRPGDPEAQGVLGRIHKDAWRASWLGVDDVDERRRLARGGAARAQLAIRCYGRAQRRHLGSYYNGINVVGLRRLLRHLDVDTADARAGIIETSEDLIALVRLAASDALERAYDSADLDEVVWPAATLGELELLVGEVDRAVDRYREATAPPGVTLFQVESMLSQLTFYEELGLRAEAVAAVREALEPVRRRAAPPTPSYDNVLICSGHMIDSPDRIGEPRFPREKEDAVGQRLRYELEAAGAGHGTLAISGGARGADILFAEHALELGAAVRLLLPLPKTEFLSRSVRLPADEGNWEQRFARLVDVADVGIQPYRIGEPPPEVDVFARNNLWILDTARAEATGGGFSTLLVWDEQPSGDGPGGTSDFARRARSLSARFAIVNPLKLEGAPR